ncbi:glutathione S-transferase family protein [Sagittula stellata]|uniref:Putative Glutathione S-transferase n=1 Tax=Sagittula stellata (strain ATCC 700073 / DSM 11524 / E-37) TaxID=388399 RepID=A3JZ74_SAGS3|nr:glutathione S-transferase family protein [Sagittula stellata]EBA09777.1 Putative Glutathione S-transferase [Sagittula stellata E-37]
MKNITITAYDWVPDFAQGHVRDLRVRWALREAGLPYDVTLIEQGRQTEPGHLARQPFAQVPTLDADEARLFESGAIVWRIAERSPTLMPEDAADRDSALSWCFSALNSVEPFVAQLTFLSIFAQDKEAAGRLVPQITALVERKLKRLSDALGDKDWLVADRFTAADVLMVTVLRDVPEVTLAAYPALRAYRDRGTARPAFAAALAEQMAPFAEHAPRYEKAS